jgi:hypothetical protein
MTLGGVFIQDRETAPPRTPVTDTGQGFFVGFAEKGSYTRAVKLRNMTDFKTYFGSRVSYGTLLYDTLQAYFAEGGTVAYVGRVVGPTPVSSTANLLDQSGSSAPGDVALVATASSPGSWGDKLNVVVDYDAGSFTLTVTHDDLGTLVTSPSLADRDAAISWAASYASDWIVLTLGASAEDPRDGSYSLASGDDDHANATDATRLAALNLFTRALGPGQVAAPGIVTTAAHTQLLEHARDFERVAILDVADTGTVATLTASAAALRGIGDLAETFHDRRGKMVGPWAVIPGLLPGTTRDIPWSGIEMGIIARNDGKGLAPNENSAGENGQSRYAISLKNGQDTDGTEWTDAQLETLNDAGVNIARMVYGAPRGYGIRTLVDPTGDPWWLNFGNVRERMLIAVLADEIGERYVFKGIDGRGLLASSFRGELEAMLEAERSRNALYGNTPDEAFAVDISANTAETAAERKLLATLAVRFSEAAEQCIIELVKVPVNQSVA